MTLFGTTAAGRKVHALRLRAGDLTAQVLTMGAILQDLTLAGVAHSLTPGSDRLEDYEGPMRYHGAVVGPVANRISGAAAMIDGVQHRFEANQAGRHMLHGGSEGTHAQHWEIAEHGPAHVALRLHLGHGAGGFPGNRDLAARFEILPPATLRLTLRATTDAPTLMNLANHSYWNLDGAACWSGHRLRIAATHVLPTTADYIPTGQVAAVAEGPFDLRDGRMIAVGDPPLDNNFCLSGPVGTDPDQSAIPDTGPGLRGGFAPLREVLWLTGRDGVTMALATTAPGVQVYDGRDARRPGRDAYEALAIEAQLWPDAPHNTHFPSIALAPGETFRQITEWRFARE